MNRSLGRIALAACLAIAGSAAFASAAGANFHLMKIREIAGEQMTNDQSYIELQMYEPGQNQVAGHKITFWDADALVLGMPVPVAELTIAGPNPPNAQSQRTILVGDAAVTGRDFTLDLSPYLDGDVGANLTAAGAACFEAIPVDCVSWGGSSFTGASRLPDHTSPYDGSLTQLLGVSGLRRKINGGTCATALDAADDTNNANADFAPGIGTGGTPNSATPTETMCVAPGTPTPTTTPTTTTPKKKCKKKQKKSSGSAYSAKKKCKKKRK
jgi:hypothetical protein